MRSTRSDGVNVLALGALDVTAGKRERRGVKVNLAPRAGKFSFGRDDGLELDIAGLLCTLEASEAAIPVDKGAEHASKSESTRDAERVRENKREELLHDACENQQRIENADALAVRDASAEGNVKISEVSIVVNASQSEGTARELGDVGEAEPAAQCLGYNDFDPELDEQLKLAAEGMMQELHEECEIKERARASCVEKPSSSVIQSENIESEDADGSGVAGMRVDNRYYLTIVLGGREYKALFDPGATLSLAGPRVTEVVKDRLKEYDSVIRSVNGKVTPVVGVLDLMLKVDGEPKIISVKAVAELDHDLILGMNFCKEFDIDARLARGAWRSNDGEWRSFAGREASEEAPIFAECAGISEVATSERELVEQLVSRLLPPETDVPGVTDLVEHHIDMQGAAPVRQKPRRMSPKMFEFARGEVDK